MQDVTAEVFATCERVNREHAEALGELLANGTCYCGIAIAKEVRRSAEHCGIATDWDWYCAGFVQVWIA